MNHFLKALSGSLLAICINSAQADGAGLAMAKFGMMSSSAPLGATFIGSLGTTESTSSGSSMKLAVQEDAALYVATNGEQERPGLEMAYRRFTQDHGAAEVDKMSFAVILLTDDQTRKPY